MPCMAKKKNAPASRGPRPWSVAKMLHELRQAKKHLADVEAQLAKAVQNNMDEVICEGGGGIERARRGLKAAASGLYEGVHADTSSTSTT